LAKIWAACNADPDLLTGRMAAIDCAYRDRRLRSLRLALAEPGAEYTALAEGEQARMSWPLSA
jgi:hypothetical protein